MKKTISLKGINVEYELTVKNVKNLNLRIRDGKVYVSANRFVSIEHIEGFMQAKSKTILQAIEKYNASLTAQHYGNSYSTGEKVFVFGKEYMLLVDNGKNSAELVGGVFHLKVSNADDCALKERVFSAALKVLLVDTVKSICEEKYPIFEPYGIKYPQIVFRDMKTMWGNCYPSLNRITFNLKLAAAPIECIEYVVIHEYTHFIEANHSKKFYALLDVFCPDWKECKKKLEKI